MGDEVGGCGQGGAAATAAVVRCWWWVCAGLVGIGRIFNIRRFCCE